MNSKTDTSFSESPSPSARILISEGFLRDHEKVYVIYDDPKEGNFWLHLVPILTGKSVAFVRSFRDLLAVSEQTS